MARSKASKGAPRSQAERRALGPGMHAGRVEAIGALGMDGIRTYRVRLASGATVHALPGLGVSPALIDECARDGRTVVLVDGPEGIVIAGALQTAPTMAPDAQGTLAIEAKHLRVRAEQSIVLEVPGGSLSMEPGGAMRMEGDKLVIDMAALVRIFSARVEIP
jgi:hypothetical protein